MALLLPCVPPEPDALDPWNCRHGSRHGHVLFQWTFALVLTFWNELLTLPPLAAWGFPGETKIPILKKAFPELAGGFPPPCPGLPQHLVHIPSYLL